MFSFRSALVPAALAATLVAPVVASAQQSPQTQNQPAAQGQRHRGGFGWMREMRSLNLTATQQSQIKQLMQQYRQAHPRGSAPDRQAREQLRTKIMAILSPAQQAQLKTEMQQARARFGNGNGSFDGGRGRGAYAAPSPSPSPKV